MSEELLHILVVDDDERLRNLLKKFLSENGFLISTAANAAQAHDLLKIFQFDLAIVDVMMPGQTGLDFTAQVRATTSVETLPILLLTAMGEVDDRISGLTQGADDYLTKPFDPRELLLRIQAILKRSLNGKTTEDLAFGQNVYSLKTNQLFRGGAPTMLTSAESNLLKLFAERPGKVLTRDDLVVESSGDLNPRTLDVQINRLRRKIEDDPKMPRYLQTVRGKGYILMTDS